MATQEKLRIERTMTIESILTLFPDKAQRLSQEITNAGLHCIGCGAAVWETLEEGMRGHGKTEAEIDRLLDRLNQLLAEEADPQTISFTPRGAKKFLSILDEEGKQGWALRFGEEARGCKGFEYILDYSERATDEDVVFESEGIEIHVRKDQVGSLLGSVIDFVDGLMGAGFKISNPNVQKSCHCGNSHGY